MKRKWLFYIPAAAGVLFFGGKWLYTHLNFNTTYRVGQPLDSLNGVYVYYNGGVSHISGRNLAPDGYNLGMKYQCVEFVKRYYYEHFDHKMPDSYGNAKDFFDPALPQGQHNVKRGLRQFRHPGNTPPLPDDLLIYSPTMANPYGHVAIVSDVANGSVSIIQQNPGPFGRPRETFTLTQENGHWRIGNKRILGWLRKETLAADTLAGKQN